MILMSNLNLSCLNICVMMANTKIFWSHSPFTRYMSVKMTLFAQNTVSVFFAETCNPTSRVSVLREYGLRFYCQVCFKRVGTRQAIDLTQKKFGHITHFNLISPSKSVIFKENHDFCRLSQNAISDFTSLRVTGVREYGSRFYCQFALNVSEHVRLLT